MTHLVWIAQRLASCMRCTEVNILYFQHFIQYVPVSILSRMINNLDRSKCEWQLAPIKGESKQTADKAILTDAFEWLFNYCQAASTSLHQQAGDQIMFWMPGATFAS